MGKKRLLVDTVAIIDCHKFSCWNAVLSYFAVETVEECYKECCSGGRNPDHVQFDQALLLSQFAQPPHVVTKNDASIPRPENSERSYGSRRTGFDGVRYYPTSIRLHSLRARPGAGPRSYLHFPWG